MKPQTKGGGPSSPPPGNSPHSASLDRSELQDAPPVQKRKRKKGGYKQEGRSSTRLARLYRKLILSHRLGPIPLEIRSIARSLGLSYETVVRITGDFADGGARTTWSFQQFGFVVFLKHRRSKTARCAHPQFYVVSRYALHRCGGKLKPRLRKKTREEWQLYKELIRKLAFGLIFKRKFPANGKHKGIPSRGTGGDGRRGRSPPTANRVAASRRRWRGLAAMLEREYHHFEGAPRAKLVGWACNRFAEWHRYDRARSALEHAVACYRRLRNRPVNPVAWISEVAERHLRLDGLAVIQRRHEFAENERKARRSAPGI